MTDLDLQEQIARIDQAQAETRRLAAEAAKLWGDALWQPFIVVGGLGVTFLASLATLVVTLLRH